MKKIILIIYFFWFSNLFGLEVKLEKIVEGMNKPWSLSFINETSIIYTEKKGKLFHLDLKNQTLSEIKHNLSVLEDGQGGLLDVLYDNENVYVSYSEQKRVGKQVPLLQKVNLIRTLLNLIIFLELNHQLTLDIILVQE